MARTDARYRAAFNSLLEICDAQQLNEQLPSELALADEMRVSRTVVRHALQKLHDDNIILWEGRNKTLIRKPRKTDRLDQPKKNISIDELQTCFLDWVMRFDVPAGTSLNVTQLSKQFNVAPPTLQEFLASLVRFGLVERRERGGWMLLGFTKNYALELSDFRTLLELNATAVVISLPDEHPIWEKLKGLQREHLTLLNIIDTNYADFSRLDERFHATINSVVNNRFIVDFQKVIALIFHYHYQWDKSNERLRNEDAIREHLNWIDSLLARDLKEAELNARTHLATSKKTLIDSLRVHKHSE